MSVEQNAVQTELLTLEVLKGLSAEDLLDIPFASLEEVIGFAQPPKGFYNFLLTSAGLENVAKDGEPANMAVVVEFSIASVVELADATAVEPKVGEKFTRTWRGGQGVAYFRKDFDAVIKGLGTSGLRDTLEKLNGVTVSAEIFYNTDKDDKEKKYLNMRHVNLV